MIIRLYSKPNCPYCDKVKRFIAENGLVGINFDDHNNLTAVRSFGLMTFPVLEIEGYGAIAESEDIIDRLKEIFKLS
jgi:glutaredoxin